MIEMSGESLKIEEIVRRTMRPEMGCAVIFLGVVRNQTEGRRVQRLKFEVDEETAVAELKSIRDEAIERFGVEDISIVHRTGSLDVGESIVMIVAGAAHREPAFKACRFVIEELKRRAPIWKKEVTDTGAYWVGGEDHDRE